MKNYIYAMDLRCYVNHEHIKDCVFMHKVMSLCTIRCNWILFGIICLYVQVESTLQLLLKCNVQKSNADMKFNGVIYKEILTLKEM